MSTLHAPPRWKRTEESFGEASLPDGTPHRSPHPRTAKRPSALLANKDITDLPPMMDYNIRHGCTYLYHQGDVLYPFGHSLNYTTFDYTRLHPGKQGKNHLCLDMTVKNNGSLDSEEVVQIYASWFQSKVERPLKKLCALAAYSSPPDTALLSASLSTKPTWITGTIPAMPSPQNRAS